MFKPSGIIVAMATPFNDDESVNETELRNQVNRFIAAGIDGLFCLGTNGEFYALSFEEKVQIMEIVKDEASDKIPVYAGTGAITTSETIALTNKAKEIGMDCVSIISPYFARCRQSELKKHFSKVAEAIDIPIILYNIPLRTGVNIDFETVSFLAKAYSNIVGIKDSSGNFDNILRYIEETDDDFSVLSGNDSLILWTLLAGGKGGISGIANIFPETLASIYDLWAVGNLTAAKIAQDSIRPIRDCLKLGNANSIIKRATELIGQNVGPVREPFNIDDPVIDEVLLKIINSSQLT